MQVVGCYSGWLGSGVYIIHPTTAQVVGSYSAGGGVLQCRWRGVTVHVVGCYSAGGEVDHRVITGSPSLCSGGS